MFTSFECLVSIAWWTFLFHCLIGNSMSTSLKLNCDPVTHFFFLLSVNDISELEMRDSISYSKYKFCTFTLNVSWICIPIPSCHPAFCYWLRSSHLHQALIVLRLWLPNFPQVITLIFWHLTLPLHHKMSELPLWSLPCCNPITGFVLSPAVFLKMMGLLWKFWRDKKFFIVLDSPLTP